MSLRSVLAPGSLLGLALLLAGAAASAEPVTTALPWERSFKDAMRTARATHRPLLVDFWASWCHWCHELDTSTYRDPAVVRSAAAFVPVKVDTEGSLAEKRLSAGYGIETLPTIGFLSPAAHSILFVESFEGPQEFVATLEKAGRAAARVLAWEDALSRRPDDPVALAGLGAHLVEQKQAEDGRRLLERAVAHDGQRPAAERKRTRILLATIHLDTRRYGAAEKLLQAAMALRPADAEADAEALFQLGEIYRDRGEIQAARDAWRRVLDEAPAAPASAKAREALETSPSS